MSDATPTWMRCVVLGAGWAMLAAGCGGDDDGGSPSDGSGNEIDSGIAPAIDAAVDIDAGDDPGTACDDAFAGALFCSGFEAETLADSGFEIFENGGTATVSNRTPWRGNGALRSEVALAQGARSAAAVAISRPPLPQTGSIYMRTYVRPSELHPDTTGSIVFMQLQRNSGSTPSVAVYLRSDFTLFTFLSASGPVSPTGEPLPLLPGEWACVEMHVELSDQPIGRLEVLVDGTQIIDGTDIVTVHPEGGYTDAQVGIAFAGPDVVEAAIEADELVVSTTPIGCAD